LPLNVGPAGASSRAAVLVDDDVGELLDGRLGRRLVERDHAILDHAHAVAIGTFAGLAGLIWALR
jgi:hypothetical protein